MDPAWLAYYQSMSYYSMMQAGMTGATSSGTGTSTTPTATDSTASNNGSSTTPGLQISFFFSLHLSIFSVFSQQLVQQPVNLITANSGLNIIDRLDRTIWPINSPNK